MKKNIVHSVIILIGRQFTRNQKERELADLERQLELVKIQEQAEFLKSLVCD